MSANPKPQYTLEEYLEMDRNSEDRLGFWNGEVFSMSGGSIRHDDIIVNIVGTLRQKLVGRPCRVSGTEARIKVPASTSPYHYADVSVTCGQREIETLGGQEMLTNPILIIEVLSPTSEAFDRGDKFTGYKSISSFKEYLLVAQNKPHLTLYTKQGENQWLQSEFFDLKDGVYLPSIDCTLSLSEVYQEVQFAP